MMDHDSGEVFDLGSRYLPGGPADADRRDDALLAVADRCSDAPETGLMLAIVDGIATFADLSELGAQLGCGDDRLVGELLESRFDDALADLARLESQDGLADTCAVYRSSLYHGERRTATLGVRLDAVDDNRLTAVEQGEVNRLIGDPAQRLDVPPSLTVQFHVGQHDVAELEQLQAQPVAIALTLLVQQANIAHRGDQPMCGAARITGRRAYLAERERPVGRREAVEDVDDLDQRLHPVVGYRQIRFEGVDHSRSPFATEVASRPPLAQSVTRDHPPRHRSLHCVDIEGRIVILQYG